MDLVFEIPSPPSFEYLQYQIGPVNIVSIQIDFPLESGLRNQVIHPVE